MAPQVLPRRWIVALCGAVVLGSLAALPVSPVAAATTYTVNALTDTGAGAGTTGDLRYAINQVNAGSGGDTINITATGTITLTQGTLTLAKSVTITGPGAASLVIDGGCVLDRNRCLGGGGSTVMTVNSRVTARISGFTIQHGNANDVGGGIINNGTLTLTDSDLLGNNSYFGGGAIENTGALTIANTTFEMNCACALNGGPFANGGGAIASTGSLVITTSSFVGNFATAGGLNHAGGIGGAIDTSGTATITNSTFSSNGTAGAYNGGAQGGAIANSGRLTVTNSTLSGNSVTGGFATGGGIENDNGTVNLTNTIVANSTGGDLYDPAPGNFIGYNNLIDDAATAASFMDGVQGNIVGHPAVLGTLGNYGGPTQTIPLLLGSPAINAGAPVGSGPAGATVPATDQRDWPRVGSPDIGAYEVQNATLTCGGSTTLTIRVGQTLLCTAVVQSSDPTIVAADGVGNITGVRAGQATMTTTQAGVTGTVTVTVVAPTPIGLSVPPAPQSRPSGTTGGSGSPPPAPASRSVPGAASAGSTTGPTPNPAPPQR